jgi:hypothetical protein
MERIPGSQPKSLDDTDNESLAVLGHLIETWHTAQVGTEAMLVRYERLVKGLTDLATTLEGTDEPLLDELLEDINSLAEFEGSDEDFVKLCSDRAAYWIEVRREYVTTL